ncbi:MAG: iron-sulfur cluster assembly scaffold protein [Hyphomonadaceae bacterium]
MADLYHNRVLELAANIPALDPLDDAEGQAEKVSRICGSTVAVRVRLNAAGTHVDAISVDPKACALGQASTSILAEGAVGASIAEIKAARDGLRDMLKNGADAPKGRFWELRHLAGVADYPPRHGSTLLAFEAALAAIDAALTARAAASIDGPPTTPAA